jgi:ribosomal protein S12 methylthiotransferase
LGQAGVKEIILVAQNLTHYGKDLGDGTTLVTLLKELVQVPGIAWIRLHYLYPHEITDELIDLIAAEKKILPYLDIPIQHVNNNILRRMHRPETKESIAALFDKLRAKIPQVVIRTSLIVGLPGEGEAEVEELMDFLRCQKLPRAGVFVFSPQEGTEAAEMPDRCSTEEAEERRDRVMALQNQIMDDYDRQQVGGLFDVLCETREEDTWVGRRYADSPDIDELVYFTGENVKPGDIVRVRITSVGQGCLLGETV